ncbi:ATP-binding protein [Phenylobacterium sp.]|uniref:ATP-binding protein n=1 Tax=Phenylobacterium sp. TaxID=1871053 RepID=UPI00122C0B0E|nr:ATP-binding protein [Phenylobacterium sp.]THD50566.1 MAG: response regulator [Phenylobacterium sp.]
MKPRKEPTSATPAAAEDRSSVREALVALVCTMPIRVLMVDREMRVLAASPSSEESMRTASNPEYLGRTVFEIDPEYFLPFAQVCARCLQGETITAPRVRARRGDGEIWLRTQISPWRDNAGEIGGLMSVSVEITDVVELLQATERSEQRLKMAVEIAEVHVWEQTYATGEIVTIGTGESFFDGSLDPAEIARDTNITIHPEDRERIAEPWRIAVESDTPYRPEYRINRADGKEVWATAATKLVRDVDGNPLRLVGAMLNITAQKAAEAELTRARDQAEAANRAKSSFLATMSHEIRTPLNGVLGMAQAMEADELAPAQRERLNIIRQSGEVLLSVLNDVLDLSKIEAGKLELEPMDFDVSVLAQQTFDAFKGVAAGKSLAFSLEVAEDAKGRYHGDPGRIRQILSNLIANSLKFTDTGAVSLAVARRGEDVVFTVSDTGIGIPPDRIEDLFHKFEQVDASTTRRFGGTGLGLAICRQLAGLMGSQVTAASDEGFGSRFELAAPLPRVGDEAQPAPTYNAAAQTRGAGPALQVLAAEDNSVNQLVLSTLLKQGGVDPRMVSNGAEALAAWREQAWDVILMDIQMPVMDGVTATEAIRAAERATGRWRTPILALTANAMAHQLEEYRLAGLDGMVAKPIRVEELFKALNAALDAGAAREGADATAAA